MRRFFRTTNKANPYPPRMGRYQQRHLLFDVESMHRASYKNAFDVNLYHINDYHGAAAPLYLLPETLPCALSPS